MLQHQQQHWQDAETSTCCNAIRHCRYIEELIDKEIAGGLPSERVVVAGFSQGGAVALMALRSEHKLAGVIGEGS
jgi:predicted esterase